MSLVAIKQCVRNFSCSYTINTVKTVQEQTAALTADLLTGNKTHGNHINYCVKHVMFDL